MGDAFGTTLERTPRTHVQDLFSDVFASALWGGGYSGNPVFRNVLAQAFGGLSPMYSAGLALPPGGGTPGGGGTGTGGGGVSTLGTEEEDQYAAAARALGIPVETTASTVGGPNILPPAQPGGPPGGYDRRYPPDTPPGPGGQNLSFPTSPLGEFLQRTFATPSYQGTFTAGFNPLQTAAYQLGLGGQGQFNPNVGQSIISQLLGSAGGAGPGTGLLSTAGQGLTQLGLQGATPDVASIFQALDQQRQAGLGRDIRDIREQFSLTGNRFSTDLARAIGQRQSESEANFLGESSRIAAQLAPQLYQGQIQALSQAGGVGNLLNQLALGAQTALPSAFQTTSLLPGSVAQQGFGLGEQFRGVQQGDLDRMYNEFLRTQLGLLPTAVGYAGGAPVITSQGIGSQALGAGSTIAASALGAK